MLFKRLLICLLVCLFLFGSAQEAFAQKGPTPARKDTIGKFLEHYWLQPESVRNEVRHIFKNLGVSKVYLTGNTMKLGCVEVLQSTEPKISTEHYNMSEQELHPATAMVLMLMFTGRSRNLNDALYTLANGIISDRVLNRPNIFLSSRSIYHILKPREELHGVIRPFFLPLELYKEDFQDTISNSNIAGILPEIEDLIYKAALAANKQLPIINKSDIFSGRDKKVYIVPNHHSCDGNDCLLLITVLTKDGFRQDSSISYKKNDPEKIKVIAGDLFEIGHLVSSI